jgi:hypothetical protein
VLVQRVQTATWTTLGGGEVLVLPPTVYETQRGEPTQRSIDRDLLHAQAVRDLQPVELGATLAMDAQSFEQHTGVELEHKSTSGPGHVTPRIVESSPPRNR